MTIVIIESAWRDTGIWCPYCWRDVEGEPYTCYTDGHYRPQCANPKCLHVLSDQYLYHWLITRPEHRRELMERWVEWELESDV